MDIFGILFWNKRNFFVTRKDHYKCPTFGEFIWTNRIAQLNNVFSYILVSWTSHNGTRTTSMLEVDLNWYFVYTTLLIFMLHIFFGCDSNIYGIRVGLIMGIPRRVNHRCWRGAGCRHKHVYCNERFVPIKCITCGAAVLERLRNTCIVTKDPRQ